ncbi:MAG: GntR family transcriptional regulator [Treponema sp.]|nr:GntR family transcriptional regulator [Treponema sp.]
MHIIINNQSMVPVYEQLVTQIKNAIIEGDLKENSALPSVRVFANELKISALTIKKAYDHLEDEGFVVTVHGKGTFVASTNQNLAIEGRKKLIETELSNVIEKAKLIGLTGEEIHSMVDILLEE